VVASAGLHINTQLSAVQPMGLSKLNLFQELDVTEH
jgi:hypothetical protein